MQTLSDYLTEHPFHDYIYVYNSGVYHTPHLLLDKYVERVEKDNYSLRYIIYVL